MKQIIIFALLLFPIAFLAQSGTTLDEYKYLTKGYAYQKEMGLDGGKTGYTVRSMYTATNGVNFNGLFLESAGTIRGVLVVIKGSENNFTYLGLPTNDAGAEVQRMAAEDAKQNLNLNAKEKFDVALLEFSMFQLSGKRMELAATVPTTETPMQKTTPNPSQGIEEYGTVIPLRMERKETMTKRSGEEATPKAAINNNVITNHDLAERTFITAPVVMGTNPKAGTVVIKFCADREGNVKNAKFTQRGSTTFDSKLRKMALSAAKKTKFSTGLDAEQCGNITFTFK